MRKLLIGGAAILALVSSAEALAQSSAGRGGAFRISTHAARTVRSGPARTALSLPVGTVTLNGSTLLPLDTFGTFPVPGLGFDFAHLAAVTQHVKVSDFSVLTTAQRVALARQLTPIVPIAFPFFPAPAQIILIQQPPVIVVPSVAASEAAPEAVSTRPAAPEESAAAAGPPVSVREVGEFVLVRRDGTLVFAVAFITSGDLLTYITPEGIRRSFPLTQLDTESTRRMNEERGTALPPIA